MPEIKQIEQRTTRGNVEIRKTEDGKPMIVGYAAVFHDPADSGTEYQLWDGLVERIDPGAFDRALRERDDARALFNHDPDNLLGRVSADTLHLSVDSRGLWYEFPVDTADPDHARVLAKIERGDLTGSSFSFAVEERKFSHQEEGPDVRTLLSVHLFDVGPVTFPAYEATTAGQRAEPAPCEAANDWEAWLKAERNAAMTSHSEALRRLRQIDLSTRALTKRIRRA